MIVPYSSFVPHHGDFPRFQLEQIYASCQDDDIVVEVGAFLGYGVCFACEQFRLSGRHPKFYAMDTWDEPVEFCQGAERKPYMPWGELMSDWRARGGMLYDSFRFYLDGSPYKEYLYDHVQFPPASCMDEFVDGTVSFVFLNYSQKEERVEQEIQRWRTKLRSGGKILAGATETRPVRILTKE